jgi:recombination protein RecA
MNAYQIAAAQDAGKIVCIVDVTRVFDAATASASGVDMPRLLVSQPDTGDQAFEIIESLARSGAVDIILAVGGLPFGSSHLRSFASRTNTDIREC